MKNNYGKIDELRRELDLVTVRKLHEITMEARQEAPREEVQSTLLAAKSVLRQHSTLDSNLIRLFNFLES